MDDQNPVSTADPAAPGASAQKPAAGAAAEPGWERRVLEKLALDTLEERRRARRWGIFFKLLGFAFAALALVTMSGLLDFSATRKAVRHTALIDVKGVIEPDGEASAEVIIEALRSAFEDTNTAGVVLRINSPGGSPVQAGIVHDEIKRLRAKYPKTPIYAVVEEVCASGSYYLAVATDRVFVDKASLVGSIGVLMDGFGFVGTMDKVGAERRLLTAGRNKAFLDPFSPLSEEHRKHAQQMLDEIHGQFIGLVKAGRGDRLKDTPDLFSGLVWTGARSVELGLADELGTVGSVARDVIKAEDVVDYSVHETLAERFAKRIGASGGRALAQAFSAAAGELRLR